MYNSTYITHMPMRLWEGRFVFNVKKFLRRLEEMLEIGGMKKDIILLVISGVSLIISILNLPLPLNPAWIAIILCGIPIVLKAIIGLVTRFDIKADVLVSLALSDTVREASASMLERLCELKVRPVLLTGDNEKAAAQIAGQLGIGEFYANCLPEEKLTCIAAWQKAEEEVCMIGDGINDAPALKAADVGIAMGGVGSDIAMDAADIVPVDDKIGELPQLVALSKRMMRTIRFNLTFSMALNLVAIILAIAGILNPVVGALVHNAGSVLVVVNSALLLGWERSDW